MFKMIRWFLWGLFLVLLIATVDQVLLRVDLPVPGYAAVQNFYTDFRSRLFGLVAEDPIGAKIARPEISPAKGSSTAKASPKKKVRYLYADGEGALQFADSLDEVPLQYRKNAQPLAE